MRFFLISDNVDTQLGLRLCGIEGVVVHEADEIRRELQKACGDPGIGIVLITGKLVGLVPDLVDELKLNRRTPLILEISDRHGSGKVSESIRRYVQESVGIRL